MKKPTQVTWVPAKVKGWEEVTPDDNEFVRGRTTLEALSEEEFTAYKLWTQYWAHGEVAGQDEQHVYVSLDPSSEVQELLHGVYTQKLLRVAYTHEQVDQSPTLQGLRRWRSGLQVVSW